jgi:rod shape-determining protein MreC
LSDRPGYVFRITAPLKSLAQRFAYLLLLGSAVGIMLAGKADPLIFERARMVVIDATAPVLDALSRPAATVADVATQIQDLARLQEENAVLRVENARLLEWQNAARTLMTENSQLRDLLKFVPDATAATVTARVIGDSDGTFIRSLLINAGERDGIRRGQAAMTGEGLLGRIAAVGNRSSRVLLIIDLNSRVPVVIETSRARAVLAGDNSERPKLIYLSANSEVKVGDRIVTSGHGGVFPPGLPVGVVSSIGGGGVRVEPFARPYRLEYVRLVDFGLGGVVDDTRRRSENTRRTR